MQFAICNPPNTNNPLRATRIPTHLTIDGLSTPLPAALYIWPDHRSYAGQPTIEIHTISSPPILDALVETLVHHGARVARPGEFTLRAFLAGKIDLVQAEAVLGVIEADSTERLHQALTQLAGGISGRIRELREQLLIDLADLEAGLDFVDEDIEFVDRQAMTNRLQTGVEWLQRLERESHERGQTTGRKSIVLAGLPNAGKSTLFNALVGRDAAVVSPTAGTTRDWLTAVIDLDGLTAELIDTAGAEPTHDAISTDAQTARHERMAQADLILWCTAANESITPPTPQSPICNLQFAICNPTNVTKPSHQSFSPQPASSQFDAPRGEGGRRPDEGPTHDATPSRPTLHITTKSDLTPVLQTDDSLAITAATGQGLPELRAAIRKSLSNDNGSSELITSTLARCSESLSLARESLERAAQFSAMNGGEELVAFELRQGLDALGQIAGVIYTDDLLDRIFSRFCIGK